MSKKVLVVDDHGHIRFMIENRLKKSGFETATAENGDEAVKQAVKEKPDIIIMDLMMPGTDGIEASRRIRAIEELKNVPIIMLTAVSSKKTVLQSIHAGINDYIIKPFKADDLVNKIIHQIGEPEKKTESTTETITEKTTETTTENS